MSLAIVHSRAQEGVSAPPVTVEVHLSGGLPGTSIVGLPETAVKEARDRVRWFPALVSNHVMDLIARYDPSELPPELTAYVRDRQGYDYLHHAEVGSSNSTFVADDVVDRFCIVGPVEEHKRRLQELADIGVDQFNIYLMNGEEEACLHVYGQEIIPAFSSDTVKS